MAATRSGSAKAKGPGWGAAEPAGGDPSVSVAQGLSATAAKHEKISRAPGAAAAANRANALAGSAKNITPWREKYRSTGASVGASATASPTTKRHRPSGSSFAARSPATATRSGDRSRPITSASRLARVIARLVVPAPQPMSTNRARPDGATARIAGTSVSSSPAKLRSVRRHSRAQVSPTLPVQSAVRIALPLLAARPWDSESHKSHTYRGHARGTETTGARRHRRAPSRRKGDFGQRSSSSLGPAIISSATFSVRWRIARSSRSAISGFSRRKVFEFSRPWPMRTLS